MTPDLEGLKFIEAADVYKNGVLTGRLVRAESGAVRFGYLPEYVGDPVAFTLPVTRQPVETPGAGLPPFFAGLLPKGHRLTVLRRATKTSPDDELTLLPGVGTDTPGDVQVVPAGTAPVEPVPPAAHDPAEMDFNALTDAPDRHALPGVQAKASASILTTTLTTSTRRAILKIDQPAYPHLVANEHLHLLGARGLKIEVAQASVVHDRLGVPGLLVERLDRASGPDGGVVRLALEDAAQVLDVLPARKYTVDSELVVKTLAGAAAPRWPPAPSTCSSCSRG